MTLAVRQKDGKFRAVRAELRYEQGKLINIVADGLTWQGEPFDVVKRILTQDATSGMGRATLSRYHIENGRLMEVQELGEVEIDLSAVSVPGG
jgi:hypothetical protein